MGVIMPKSENQKMKILYLMSMMLKETDSDHKLTVNQMIDSLSRNHGIEVERKTIYADLEILKEFGLDIDRDKTKTFNYYVASRDFELSELKLLVDVIQSSKFITTKKSEDFIKKIENLTSVHLAKSLHRQVYVNRQIKTMNESIYNNVDTIQEAIANNRKISFKYFEYTVKKEKQYRRNGQDYYANPIFLTWDNENYYLVSYCPNEKMIKHYRVDKMVQIKVVTETRDEHDIKIDPANYTNKVFGMFIGDEHTIEIEFDNSLIDVIIDRFGKMVPIIRRTATTFTIHVKVEISPVFIGWIMQFGNKATVLSPSCLIDELKDRAAELLGKYS